LGGFGAMHQIDASFKARKEEAAARRRRQSLRRWAAAAGALTLCLVLVAGYLTRGYWSFDPGTSDDTEFAEPGEEAGFEEEPVFVPAIVDLAGDPMIISIGRDTTALPKTQSVPRPEELSEPGIAERLSLLSDIMLSSSERFMTTLPSSPEDFAYFQAQRSRAPPSIGALLEEGTQGAAAADGDAAADPGGEVDPAILEAGAGWGETVTHGQAALPEFKRTRIQNTTSIAFVVREAERYQPTDDIFVKVNSDRTLDGLVTQHGFSQEEAKLAGEALKEILGRDALAAGEVVAMRGLKDKASAGAPSRLMQVSLYANDVYVGTIARSDEGAFTSGADPWVDQDLFSYSGQEEAAAPTQRYRILDAIYSTAARNGVPTGIIGEAIMLLSRSHDLNAFVEHDDRFLLVYSDSPRDGNMGRVLYVAVRGSDKDLQCFVYRPRAGSDFACMTDGSEVVSQTVLNGMLTPVNGVMKSTFGPRRHPILKTVRIHKGVDWAAPSGTPVFAAFDGEIVYAGDGADYGNLVRIKHAGSRETRYAHLDRFDGAARPGNKVRAGDVIGYVGTTGLSTGPHLHFELYVRGEAVDPLQSGDNVASDGSAADQLVDQIIRVESAGNATAKNPLSTATGLGQFIESTWLRMMRTYRPDLARSLSREDQLALRTDPTISREMVRNLAREGESYLRARGHAITAGRLYLCHFLGMDGAHVVLSAAADAALLEVLGEAVIKANPFLTGKDVAYVIDWAERKMRGRAGRRPTAVAEQRQVKRASPEFTRYKEAITALVTSTASVQSPL
jgi:murein DD-endopeptidase MepM/ murein hydrolase activator NlpD